MIRILVLLVALLSPTLACPFCNPGESDIFGDISEAQAVVLVSKVDKRKYKIVESLLGPAKAGRVVVAAEPQGKLGKQGTLLLTTAGPPNLPYWSDAPRVLDKEELAFARKALQVSRRSEADKWDFAARHLHNESSEISRAAYNLLATAPLSEVQKRASIPGQANLVAWVKDPKISPERRALFLLMSYQGLQPADSSWLKKALFDPNISPSSPLLGPLAVAYLNLLGPKAVAEIESHFYKPNYPASRITPLNRALTLVAEQSPRLKSAVTELFRRELKHPQRGPFVLAPLALWQDASGMDDAEGLFKKNPQVTWVKVAVIRYFRTLPTSVSEAPLRRLSQTDATLVERTTDTYRRSDLGID